MPDDPALSPPFEVRLHQARILATHVMIVAKINRDAGLLEIVHRNFERWQQPGRCVSGHPLRAWRRAFRLPWPRIAALLTEQSERAIGLRSTAPLFGVPTARERRRIFEAFRLKPKPCPKP